MTNVSSKGGPGGRASARASNARPPTTPKPQFFDPHDPGAFNPDLPRPNATCPDHPAGTKNICSDCKVDRLHAEYHDKQVELFFDWYDAQDEDQ
jgi:hypothetical protein